MNRFLALAVLLFSACSSTPQVSSLELGPSVWVSFDFHNDEYIFLRGTINGNAADFLLDTGAEVSLIDGAFAEGIGLRTEGDLHLSGVAGGVHARRAGAVEISVANLTAHSPLVAIADFSGFEDAIGHPLSAVLGVQAFARAIVDIDYPNKRIAFRRAEGFEYDGPGRTVQLKPLRGGRHAIAGAIEDRPSVWYLIDTGSSSTVTVAASVARRQALLEGRTPTSEQVSGGVGGLTTEDVASVETFSIGGYELRDMPMAVSSTDLSKRPDRAFDGIVGGGVLSRFRILLDYGHSELHLEPGPAWQSGEFSRNLLGLAVTPDDGRLRVLFVAPGSPAQQAGWQAGMFVTAVDGIRSTVAEMRAALRARNAAGVGTRIVLANDREAERPVVLARYY